MPEYMQEFKKEPVAPVGGPGTPLVGPQPHQSGSRLVSIIGAVLGLLVMVGLVIGGAILAGRVYDPVWNPFRPSVESVVSEAAEKTKNLAAFHLHAEIKGLLQSSIVFDGDVDATNTRLMRSKGSLSIDSDMFGGKVADANYIIDGSKFYGNITNGNATLIKEKLGVDIEKVRGQWFLLPSISPDTIWSQYGALSKSVLIDDMYSLNKKLPDETIDGQLMYRYLLKVDKNKLEKGLPAEQAAFLKGMNDLAVELVIGSKDGNLHRVVSSGWTYNDGHTTTPVSVVMTLSQFDEIFTIEAPAQFLKAE